MEMQNAMKVNVDGKKVALDDLVDAWKENGRLSEKATKKLHKNTGKPDEKAMAEYYDDGMWASVPYGITTFADLKVANEAQEAIVSTRVLTAQLLGLIDGITYSREIEHGDKAAAIRAVTEEYVALVMEQMDDVGEAAHGQESDREDGLVEFAESMGSVVRLGENETLQENDSRAPLLLDLQIIKPGPGNSKDKRWYPADILKRDAHVFEGVDVFVTDHEEHGEKTKVGKIKEIIGFTPEGGPIGRTIIFDPDTAEKTRNRAVAEELATLHCSILASGMARDGQIDGQNYSIVESITSARSVDLVGRAGAGGEAVAIAEKEKERSQILRDELTEAGAGGHASNLAEKEAAMPKDKKDKQEISTEEKEKLEGSKDVILKEEGKEQPSQEPDSDKDTKQEKQEEALSESDVKEALDSTNLPDEAKAWLAEAQYSDKGALAEAVGKATERVKAITGSGNVVGMAETAPPSGPVAPTEESKLADYNRVMAECGFPAVGP